LLAALQTFDEIFGVLKDEDAARMSGILAWAKAEGRQDIAPSLIETVAAQELSSEVIEQKIAAMEQARKARDFKQSDALRAELTAAGIVIENTKDGVRWRRK